MTPSDIFLADYCKPQMLGAFIDLSLCDEIINFFEDPQTPKIKSNASNYLPEVSVKIRDGMESSLVHNNKLQEKYISELLKVLNLYKEHFPEVDRVIQTWGLTELIKVQKTSHPDQAFHALHTEATGPENCKRVLVFMTYLNDIDDGGETDFPNQQIKIKPKKGLTVIWPAHFGYPHRGLVSPTQTKYVVTGWFSFIPNNKNNV